MYAYWQREHRLWLCEHPDEVPGMVMERLKSELALSEEQIPRVADVVRRSHVKLEALQDEIRPRVDQCCCDMEDEMAVLLTEDQYAKWLPSFRELRKLCLP